MNRQRDRRSRRSDTLASIRGWAPDEVVALLDQVSFLLPRGFKVRLQKVLDCLPTRANTDNLQRVLELIRGQWQDIQSEVSVRIAFVGPAQTGKSSLVRAITQRQVTPESMFSIVDTRTLDALWAHPSGRLPAELQEADLVAMVLDARLGVSDDTIQMYDWLTSTNKPVLVALNKIDLVENAGSAIRSAAEQLGVTPFPVSVFRSDSLDKLLKAFVSVQPKALYPLCQGFPEFRRPICQGIVTESSLAASVVGAMPTPVSDLLPITTIQAAMVLKIGHAFGHRLNRGRARELLPVLGAGILLREASHRLSRHFPDQSRLIGCSVAGVWTLLLGQASIRYFEGLSPLDQKATTTETGELLAGLRS